MLGQYRHIWFWQNVDIGNCLIVIRSCRSSSVTDTWLTNEAAAALTWSWFFFLFTWANIYTLFCILLQVGVSIFTSDWNANCSTLTGWYQHECELLFSVPHSSTERKTYHYCLFGIYFPPLTAASEDSGNINRKTPPTHRHSHTRAGTHFHTHTNVKMSWKVDTNIDERAVTTCDPLHIDLPDSARPISILITICYWFLSQSYNANAQNSICEAGNYTFWSRLSKPLQGPDPELLMLVLNLSKSWGKIQLAAVRANEHEVIQQNSATLGISISATVCRGRKNPGWSNCTWSHWEKEIVFHRKSQWQAASLRQESRDSKLTKANRANTKLTQSMSMC